MIIRLFFFITVIVSSNRTNVFAKIIPDSTLTDQFSELSMFSLEGTWFGSSAWCDYDNDNDQDILLTGLTTGNNIISKIYRNDGNDTFTEQTSISLTGVCFSSVAWGDYDNDGRIDILLTGYTSIQTNNSVSKIYRNNGDNTFTEQTSIILPGVFQGSVAWGDYNNDGKLDFILTGQSGDNPISRIYRNNGNNSFTEQSSIPLAGVKNSSVDWGDYDNDGDLDLLLVGFTGSNRVSKIYRNNGNNTFSEQLSISLIGVSDGSALWGDYDNDGKLDILLTGTTGNDVLSKIYRNNGNNTFSEKPSANLTGVFYSSAAWGDYNNDGNLDIFLTGATSNSPYIKSMIYLNEGSGFFTVEPSFIPTGTYFSSASCGDLDNDGDLDLLLTGNSTDGIITKVIRNNCLNQNMTPDVPTNLTSIISEKNITFKWNKSDDGETPIDGLKYNLVIGTTPGGVNSLSPMSERRNGYRRIVSLGNTNHDTSWTIKDLPNGKYYWSVQAIDNSFSGSGFAPEQYFSTGIKVIPEGLYNVSIDRLNMKDTAKAYLRNIFSPYAIIDSAKAIIDSISFSGNFEFLHAPSGTYYIMLKHRNSIETWSKYGGIPFIQGSSVSYDFTTDSSNAFGYNMVKKGNRWCIYSGDVNQDGNIDMSDLSLVDFDNHSYQAGYLATDLTGDFIVDMSDLYIVNVNSLNYVSKITP